MHAVKTLLTRLQTPPGAEHARSPVDKQHKWLPSDDDEVDHQNRVAFVSLLCSVSVHCSLSQTVAPFAFGRSFSSVEIDERLASPTSFPEFPQATATATQTSTESIHQLRLSLPFSLSKQSRQHEPVRHKSTGVLSTDRHRDHEASPPLTGAHRRPSIRVGGNGAAAGRAPWLDGLSNRRHTWHRQRRQLRTAAHDSGQRLREAAPAAALPVPRARTLWSLC